LHKDDDHCTHKKIKVVKQEKTWRNKTHKDNQKKHPNEIDEA
jgi:hypothetical protein